MFGPLGMVDTGFGVPADKLHRLSAMYGLPDLIGQNYSFVQLFEAAIAGFNERIDVSATYPTDTPEVFQRGGVGLFSTVADYMRFGQMLAAGGTLDGVRVVGRKTLELMHVEPPARRIAPLRAARPAQSGHGLRARVTGDARRRRHGRVGFGRRVRMGRRSQDLLLGRSGRGTRRRVHVAVHDRHAAPRTRTSAPWSTKPSTTDPEPSDRLLSPPPRAISDQNVSSTTAIGTQSLELAFPTGQPPRRTRTTVGWGLRVDPRGARVGSRTNRASGQRFRWPEAPSIRRAGEI